MKYLYALLGLLCVAVGAVGVVLPVLPTTPFLLLAAVLFAKSSTRLDAWFRATKLYQNHLDSFVQNRSMTLKTKLCILLPASAMLLAAFFAMHNLPGRVTIAVLIAFKYWYFFAKIKTIPAALGVDTERDSIH